MTHRPEHGTSIRRRLLALIVLPATAILLAGTVVDSLVMRAPVWAAYDSALLDSALAVAANIRVAADRGISFRLADAAIGMLRTDSADSVYYRVNGPDGAFLAGDRDLEFLARSGANPEYRSLSFRGEAVRAVTYRKETPAGPVYTVVAETLHKRERFQSRLWNAALAGDLIVLAAILGVVGFGIQAALRPLEDLAGQIGTRRPDDLGSLDPLTAPLEVQGLVRTLNRLFHRINDNRRWQHQFMESAAHQLRTPLAGMMAQLGQLVGDEPDAARRERLALALGATRRLSHTTRQFLALARSGEGSYGLDQFVHVSLARVAEGCLASRLDAGVAANVELGAEFEPADIEGIEWLLAEATSNLIDNAIKYTPPGGSVTVRSGTADMVPFLEVRDTGLGIPAADRGRMTSRFVRGRFAPGDGSGLGLSIVAEVCRAHGATMRILDGEHGHGTVVRLEFNAMRLDHAA